MDYEPNYFIALLSRFLLSQYSYKFLGYLCWLQLEDEYDEQP